MRLDISRKRIILGIRERKIIHNTRNINILFAIINIYKIVSIRIDLIESFHF